jgi:hypothetical protein
MQIVSNGLSNIKALSPNLKYIVAQNYLYKFNNNSQAYSIIYTLTNFFEFKLLNFEDRLIISGSTSTVSGGGYQITQKIWIMK